MTHQAKTTAAIRTTARVADALLRCPGVATQLDQGLGTRLWRIVAGSAVQSAACSAGRWARTCGRDNVGLAILSTLAETLQRSPAGSVIGSES